MSSMQPLCFYLKTLFDCLLATMMASLTFLVKGSFFTNTASVKMIVNCDKIIEND